MRTLIRDVRVFDGTALTDHADVLIEDGALPRTTAAWLTRRCQARAGRCCRA